MALPKVTIKYLNGLLGVVPESEDGILALVHLGAAAVSDTFVLGKPYKIYGPSSLSALGLTKTNNARIVEIVHQFYDEAGEGTPVYIVGYPSDVTMTELCNKDTGDLRLLVESLKGELRGAVISGSSTDEAVEGIADDVLDAAPLAQALAEHCATELYAPLFIALEGRSYDNAADLPDMTDKDYNRVLIIIGDTKAGSQDAAVGTFAGRVASLPIQRNIGAVVAGALEPLDMYLGEDRVDLVMDDVRIINDKGYIVPRIHVGRPGYYFSDDSMCCDKTDDYAHLTARRTVDKAARIAYDTLLDFLLSEVEINEDGTMQAAVVKSWQAAVESAIDARMTASGELSAVDGSGCACVIDASQNVIATGQVNVVLKVRPYGYAREIVCELGFLTANV